jgi:23S rRNA (cytosine1962-C5)-methyltransferase
MTTLPPLVCFEDDHLLVVNKPSGLNTHAPSPYTGEGLYEWLRHREPRWASLATIHRLDKDTSGLMVFSKGPLANRSLTEQFARRQVEKRYVLLTDRPVPERAFTVVSWIERDGDRYVSRARSARGARAETRFRVLEPRPDGTLVEATPLTGRTHQIRVHAAARGFPLVGDALYGGSAARRLCLHAQTLGFRHPATHQPVRWTVKPDFDADPAWALRAALIDARETDAFRLMHGAADGWPGWSVDQLGTFLLSQSEHLLNLEQQAHLAELCASRANESPSSPTPVASSETSPLQPAPRPLGGVYHKALRRQLAPLTADEASPQWLMGQEAPERFLVRENGLQFELSFREGCSVGLFLDQRDNRRRLLTNHVAAGFPVWIGSPGEGEVLNTFAYTCAFSVCAGRAGARTTSLDLSRKYLDWGRRNFALNGLDPDAHDFIHGDVFGWLRRLAKRDRRFAVVLLDPPTFSRSKQHGAFTATKDYGALVTAALALLQPGGVLLASSNAAGWKPEHFVAVVEEAVRRCGRRITHRHYAPQPPDFPVSRVEPAYLKTLWLRIA